MFKLISICILLMAFSKLNALKCYSCTNCLNPGVSQVELTCAPNELFCTKQQTRDSTGLVTKYFKGCAQTCVTDESYNNRVSCCATNLCNFANGVQFSLFNFMSIILFALVLKFYY
ncbi:unnamed protein product [Brachionus calyciflorus]|uniref:Uncharacterized protein n=1 Tax=Brachionus calyciflorus TaxID=104777 RepID=A0A814N968_9BILA|nr:unnamed protein product [Brachionus calyciflorus]